MENTIKKQVHHVLSTDPKRLYSTLVMLDIFFPDQVWSLLKQKANSKKMWWSDERFLSSILEDDDYARLYHFLNRDTLSFTSDTYTLKMNLYAFSNRSGSL